MSHGKFAVLCMLIGMTLLVACSSGSGGAQTPTPVPTAALPNPASTYCVQHGGKLDVRGDATGEVGLCVFSDGSACEEWAYYRGECKPGGQTATPVAGAGMANPASVYCGQHGGKLELRQDASGGQAGTCVFSDGSRCDEWAYRHGAAQR